MQLVEKIQLEKTPELSALCHSCKNLYNLGNYYIINYNKFISSATSLNSLDKPVQEDFLKIFQRKRKIYREKRQEGKLGKRALRKRRCPKYPNWYDLKWILKWHPIWKQFKGHVQVAQNVLKILYQMWISFWESYKDWKQNPAKYEALGLEKPHPPYYKKKAGEFIACFNHQHIPQKDQLSKKKVTKMLHFPPSTNLPPVEIVTPIDTLQQVRIIPKNDVYNLEIVYNHIDPYDLALETDRIVAIDIGLNNLACVVNNFGEQPFSINGRPLKSINQYYNKKKAKLQRTISNQLRSKCKKAYKNQGKKVYKKNGQETKNFIKYVNKCSAKELYATKQMQKMNRIRDNKIKDYMHKASRYIINYCIEQRVKTIVIGKNSGWKHKINLGKKTNQKFVQVPFNMFVEKLQYKAELSGMHVKIITEEYTSQTCFKCKIIRKANRKYRGLYVCSQCGTKVNADVNGSYNILEKAFPNSLEVEGIEGTQLYPKLINFN